MTRHASPEKIFDLPAAVLAWVLPGMGHIFFGEKRRGLVIMVGVLGLVILGLLIGGIDAVDSKNDRLWFLAQAASGPVVFGLDRLNQNWLKTRPDRLDTEGISHVNEIGTLYIALAGLMNLVVILDALHHRTVPRPDFRLRRVEDGAAA